MIDAGDGRFRRLTPWSWNVSNGFPDNWTNTGMPDGRRAFMMGNALVIGLVSRVGKALRHQLVVKERRSLHESGCAPRCTRATEGIGRLPSIRAQADAIEGIGMIGFIISSHAFASSNVPTALSIRAQRLSVSVAKKATPTSIRCQG